MALIEWVAAVLAALVLLVVLLIVAVLVRRRRVERAGGFDMSLRLGRDGWTGGWVFGIGRYRDERLEWYRTFSLAPRPHRSFPRRETAVLRRRDPDRREAHDLPPGHLVLVCQVRRTPVEMSMAEPSSTAFLAWLEAAPPGEHLVA